MKETEGRLIWNSPPDSLKEMEDVKMAWAMPMYGPISPMVYQNHLAAAAFASRYFHLNKKGSMPIIGSTDKMSLSTASNKIIYDFLQSDCTHLFWTECDMQFPFYTLPALLSHDQPIVSGLYFLRNGSGQPCLYMKGPRSVYHGIHSLLPIEVFPEDTTFRVHCCGFGCVLFKREVFEAIPAPWCEIKEVLPWEKKTGYGQDVYFYSKAADAGYDVLVDASIHCQQIEEGRINIHAYRQKMMTLETPKGIVIANGSDDSAVYSQGVPDADGYPDDVGTGEHGTNRYFSR